MFGIARDELITKLGHTPGLVQEANCILFSCIPSARPPMGQIVIQRPFCFLFSDEEREYKKREQKTENRQASKGLYSESENRKREQKTENRRASKPACILRAKTKNENRKQRTGRRQSLFFCSRLFSVWALSVFFCFLFSVLCSRFLCSLSEYRL